MSRPACGPAVVRVRVLVYVCGVFFPRRGFVVTGEPVPTFATDGKPQPVPVESPEDVMAGSDTHGPKPFDELAV
ncbi:hypothetical protein [Mycobacteroides abscessus]